MSVGVVMIVYWWVEISQVRMYQRGFVAKEDDNDVSTSFLIRLVLRNLTSETNPLSLL
jgi:hypothetical protein